MITAKEARELAGPTKEELIDEELALVYQKIEEAAKAKKRSIQLTSSFWTYGGYSGSESYYEAVRQLEDLGYSVKFHYEELQFVNIYTSVEW
jgi:hypothetical protein